MRIYCRKSITSNYQLIDLPDKELGKGGQARIYRINTPGYEDLCAKIYLPAYLTRENFKRISYMIQNPPPTNNERLNFKICWPCALAYDLNKNFIGFIMPLAFPNSRDLKILDGYNKKTIAERYKNDPLWHNKYELTDDFGMENRMKMLCNWAIAIYQIHSTQKYVIIDLKPENAMATASGRISIVDTDSFQISENNQLLFPGTAFTDSYFPPEGEYYKKHNLPFPQNLDYFAAAIVFYKILTGIHPYNGTILLPPYDKVETEADCIKEGLFAYGSKSRYIQFPSKGLNLHKNFKNLPPFIQSLFIRAFGNDPNRRPDMEEWAKTFKQVINQGQIKGLWSTPQLPQTIVTQKQNSNKPDLSPCIQIQKVQFYNFAKANNGVVLPSDDIIYTNTSYITPHITYNVIKPGDPIDIRYKLYDPLGVLKTGKFPYFTEKGLIRREKGGVFHADLGYYGSLAKNSFNKSGKWKLEFYENTSLIRRQDLYVYPAPIKPKPITSVKSIPITPTSTYRKVANYLIKRKDDFLSWIQNTSLFTILNGILVVLASIFLCYQFGYVPYTIDRDAPRYYAFTNLNLRSSQDASSDKNILKSVPYGTEFITYSKNEEWADVKSGKDKGFVSSNHLLSSEDFHILDGIWGNTDAKECVPAAKYRLALLNFYKRQGIRGGTQWQLYTNNMREKQNTVLFPRLYDKKSRFTDFIFILQNNQTKTRMLAFYSFDNETELPIYHYSTTNVPKEGYIAGASSYWGYNGLQINITFSDGQHEKAVIVSKRPSNQKTFTTPTANPAKPEDTTVSIKKHKASIKITSLSFRETDKEGNELRPKGTDIYTDFMYLCPIISYDVLKKGEPIEVWYKIYDPNNNLLSSTNSKTGFTWGHPIDRDKSQYTWRMGGWGNPNRSLYKQPGIWRIEFYEGDVCLLVKGFTVHPLSSSQSVQPKDASIRITSVTFCETNKDGDNLREGTVWTDYMYLNPCIKYDVIKKGEPLDLWYKIYKPNGNLLTGNESKRGFTWHSNVNRSDANYYIRLGGWGSTDRSTYSTAGTWRIEFYEGNNCIYKYSFPVKAN